MSGGRFVLTLLGMLGLFGGGAYVVQNWDEVAESLPIKVVSWTGALPEDSAAKASAPEAAQTAAASEQKPQRTASSAPAGGTETGKDAL